MDFSKARRILITKLRHHGDVLLASPVIQTLKNHYPHLEIDALVYADTAGMLSGHPGLSELHLIDRTWKKQGVVAQAAAEWRLLKAMQSRGYDGLIHLTEHWRGAWIRRLCGIPFAYTHTVGNRNRLWHSSFTAFARLPRLGARHTVEHNLDVLRIAGLSPRPHDKQVHLNVDAQDTQKVDRALAAAGLPAQRFVHIHPGSRWSFKCWPVEKMAVVINALHDRDIPVVLTGAPSGFENDYHARLMGQLKRAPALDLHGQLSLKALGAVSQRARVFLGVDSAPMHIAAAMNVPTIALFGPSGPHMWGPWDNLNAGQHRVIRLEGMPCMPCGNDGCAGSKRSDCLERLPVDTALSALLTHFE